MQSYSLEPAKPMHEMSLCENILQTLQQQANAQQYSKVKTIWLEIGELAGVEADALRFSFDSVMQDSIADQARLEIIDIAGQAYCSHCAKNVPIQQRYDACPECGHFPLQIVSGDQMRIKQLEVE
jgi:hydrogenase nickel incorporation protein HypA/HybF